MVVAAGGLPGQPPAATSTGPSRRRSGGRAVGQDDVIVSVDGQSVSSPEQLQSALGQHHPGDSVTIGWQDQTGQTQSAAVVLANGPAA